MLLNDDSGVKAYNPHWIFILLCHSALGLINNYSAAGYQEMIMCPGRGVPGYPLPGLYQQLINVHSQ